MNSKDENKPHQEDAFSVSKTLQGIKNRLIDPKTLSIEQRRYCVQALRLEGYQTYAIASLLSVSDRQIRRDIMQLKDANELEMDGKFAKKYLGELLVRGQNHCAYLMRLARSKDASVAEKTQAEYGAWKIYKELTERLQDVGYLPKVAKQISGDLYHHLSSGDDNPLDESRGIIVEIKKVMEETESSTPEIEKEIEVLNKRIECAEIKQDAQKLLDVQNKGESDGQE